MKHKPLIVAIAVLITLSMGRVGASAFNTAMESHKKILRQRRVIQRDIRAFGLARLQGQR